MEAVVHIAQDDDGDIEAADESADGNNGIGEVPPHASVAPQGNVTLFLRCLAQLMIMYLQVTKERKRLTMMISTCSAPILPSLLPIRLLRRATRTTMT